MFLKLFSLSLTKLWIFVFIESAHWADSIQQSRCPSVVVCLSLFMYQILRPILPPLPEVGCPKFQRFGIIGEKCWKEVVSELNIFVRKWSNTAVLKKNLFLLILPYKTWWKPRFPTDQRPLVKGYIANLQTFFFLNFFRFGFFSVFNFFFVLCIHGSPYCGIGATIRIGREIRCLPYAGFLFNNIRNVNTV